MDQRIFIYARKIGTSDEGLLSDLRRVVEDRGGVVVGTYVDDLRIKGKGKNSEWRRLLADLDQVFDQIVLADVGDLPCKSVTDVLGVLATLTQHGVSVAVPSLGIDTSTGSPAILALVAAYRRAKLSQAIRKGQAKAKQAGRRIGRPPIPPGVRRRIEAALAEGGGIRPTARRFNVSPASVVSIQRSLAANPDRQAA
jgi:DNA invertase Pin-like site-specific DNA recombinase